MCGILGILNPDDVPRAVADLPLQLSALKHRGPDAAGQFVSPDGRALLGHARLSIIDLSSANDQPFLTPRTATVFNGEIYNFPELRAELTAAGHRFATAGDTEVIARGYEHWGLGLFRRLEGMYAVGIYIQATRELVLARDMFGIKPLYVHRRGNELRFASEIKALSRHRNWKFDERFLVDILTYGFALGSHSAFEQVEQVPPGAVWYCKVGEDRKLAIKAELLKPLATSEPGSGITSDELREALAHSVRKHLISDVPVAISLSGGIDSSIVATLAVESHANLRAYTNSFDPENDYEVQYARMLSDALGMSHSVIESRVTDLERLLREIMWHLEEPIPNPAMLNSFFVGKALGEDRYKVVLIGEGADELFAGYPWHQFAVRRAARRNAARLFAAYSAEKSSARATRKYLSAAGLDSLDRHVAAQQEVFHQALAECRGSRLEQFLHYDRRYQLASSQLQRVDRMLMRHAVEGRVPFLYDNVLAAASALPDDRKLACAGSWWQRMSRRSVRQEKICLAEALAGRLPPAIASRKKWGHTGTTNIFNTSALEGLPALFDRMCNSADYAPARQALEPWIDFTLLSQTRSRKVRLATCQLLITADYFVLNQPPQTGERCYAVNIWEPKPGACSKAA